MILCIKFASLEIMASVTKRGKSWYAQVRRKGISVSQSFPTKASASRWATQTEADILSGEYKLGSEKTFVDAIDRYLEEVTPGKKSAKDEISILNTLRRQPWASRRVGDITTEMIAQYRDTELKRVKPASVLRYLTAISTVYETVRKEWQWVTINPVKDVKKPGAGPARDRIFSEDEIQRVLAELGHNAECTEIEQTIGDVFLFAIETAMRAGEIVGLSWGMIDIERRFLTLETTKNGDKRAVPLSSAAIEILRRRRDKPVPFKLRKGTLSSRFSIYLERSGIEGATFHDARHTAITRMSKKLTPFELARSAGHRNMSQTLQYFNESAESIASKLD